MSAQPTPTVQPPINESPNSDLPEAPKIPAKEENPLGKQFSAMSRKEKAINARLRQLEEREKAFQLRESEYREKYIPKDALTSNPIELLLSNGLTPDQLAGMLLNHNDPSNQALIEVRRELKKLQDAQEQARKDAEAREQENYRSARAQIAKDVEFHTRGNDDFELINAMEAHESVVELMEDTLKEDGYLPTVEQAAKEIEEYLSEKTYGFTQLKKIQARLKPAEPAPENPAPQKQQTNLEKLQGMTTLSNRQSASSGARPLTMRERMERAKLAFEGKLT